MTTAPAVTTETLALAREWRWTQLGDRAMVALDDMRVHHTARTIWFDIAVACDGLGFLARVAETGLAGADRHEGRVW